MPSLASIIREAKPTDPPPLIESPAEDPETKLRDAREAWHLWEEQARNLINQGYLDVLDKPSLHTLKDFNLFLRDRLTPRLR